jgi:membrane associated rhomboid family serine protease
MHILFNMMSLYSLGGPLERALGTLCFLGLNLAIAILSNLQYVLGSWLAYKATGDLSWLVYCSVGFSGVLFGLVVRLKWGVVSTFPNLRCIFLFYSPQVLETKLGDEQPRSLFGVCNVPAAAYPWALLILLQIMMPGISFIGHLTGILTGVMYIAGLLPWCSLKRSWILALEAHESYRGFTNRFSSYVNCPVESAFNPPRYAWYVYLILLLFFSPFLYFFIIIN